MSRWSKDDIKRQKLARATSVADGGKITLSAPPWEKTVSQPIQIV